MMRFSKPNGNKSVALMVFDYKIGYVTKVLQVAVSGRKQAIHKFQHSNEDQRHVCRLTTVGIFEKFK